MLLSSFCKPNELQLAVLALKSLASIEKYGSVKRGDWEAHLGRRPLLGASIGSLAGRLHAEREGAHRRGALLCPVG